MLPAAARLCEGLDATLEEARTVMACCTARHGSTLGRAAALLAAAAVAFAVVLAAAVLAEVVVLRRRRLSHALMLPTYGMSQYSRPASRQHSWQA
jgi:branched-subunit amino acid ABC-type transport system permease component